MYVNVVLTAHDADAHNQSEALAFPASHSPMGRVGRRDAMGVSQTHEGERLDCEVDCVNVRVNYLD